VRDTEQAESFDAALASFLGNSATIQTVSPRAITVDRRLRSEANSNGADSGRVKGAEDEAQREIKNATEVDITQVAADKLAAPSTQGAVAQADASELENPASQPPRSTNSPQAQTSQARSGVDTSGDDTVEKTPTQGTKFSINPAQSATAQNASSTSQAVDTASNPSSSTQSTTATTGSTKNAAQAATPGAVVAATASSTSKPTTNTAQTTVNGIGGGQGPRSTAFKKLLEQGQPARRTTEQQHVAQSVAKGLQLLVKEGGGEVLLKLKPVELGAITAHLSIKDARVDATFRAQTPLARDLLVNSIQDLKAALETRGLIVDRVEVVLEDSALVKRDQTHGQIAGSDGPHARTVGDGRQEGAHGRSPDTENTSDKSNESPSASSDKGATRFSSDSRSGQDGSRAAWTPTTDAEGGDRIAKAGEAATEPIWLFAGRGGTLADGFEWVA